MLSVQCTLREEKGGGSPPGKFVKPKRLPVSQRSLSTMTFLGADDDAAVSDGVASGASIGS